MAAQDYQQVGDGNPAGTMVGKSATEKVGFFGITPVVQPTAAAQATLTLTTTTTAGYGFLTGSAFSAFTAHLAAIDTALIALGLMKGS